MLKLRSLIQDPVAKASCDAFLGEFEAATVTHPFDSRLRIWDNNVVFEVKQFNGKIDLSFIQSIDKGCKHGSRGLLWFLEMASRHSVAIHGYAKRVGAEGLDQRQLKAWYKRHGFSINTQSDIVFDPVVNAARLAVTQAKRGAVLPLRMG